MDKTYNKMNLSFMAIPENEAFARSTVAAFCLSLSPTLEELNDVKTAISEAVTNCIVHAYREKDGEIAIETRIDGNVLHIKVSDQGVGIPSVEEAIQPFFTTAGEEERSGMGFTVMQTFMDTLEVISEVDKGTHIVMTKKFYGR